MKFAVSKFYILFLIIFYPGCASLGHLRIPCPAIPNLYNVEEGLYRGGQPKPGGFTCLKELAIKTVVSFSVGAEGEKQALEELGIEFIYLPMSIYEEVDDGKAIQFFKALNDKSKRPVFVHCETGRDKTGLMIAVYKVLFRGWPIKQAYKEAKQYGYFPYKGKALWKNFLHQLNDRRDYYLEAVKK